MSLVTRSGENPFPDVNLLSSNLLAEGDEQSSRIDGN